jgi:hypothetical protein
MTDLQSALGLIDSSVASVTALINNLAANPFFLTTEGTTNLATLTGNVLNIPTYEPTLQDVTTYGNTTDKDIIVENPAGTSSLTLRANSVELKNITTDTYTYLTHTFIYRYNSTLGQSIINLPDPANNATYDFPSTGGTLALTTDITLKNAINNNSETTGGLIFFTTGNNNLVTINNTNLTLDRSYEMPDADGEFVLSVNGITPVDGNVTVPIGLPYLVYTALLTINSPSGNATVTVLQNTIGDGSGDGVNDIAWSGTGPYLATMTDGPFTINKTTAVPSIYFGGGINYTLLGVRTSSSVMTFTSRRADTGASAGAFVSGIFVEIRVYP